VLTIVPTGTANLASIKAAFGVAEIAECSEQIETADRVLLPGVGSFGAAMARLREDGFDKPLAARIAAGRPTLAICVGLQIMFEASEESEGRGLGVLPGTVTRLVAARVPQLGWNRIGAGCEMVEPGYAYFANSYHAPAPEGWQVATVDYDGPIVAAIQRDKVLGCQFHPELSGVWGQALIGRWVAC
jgi:glutamine amidotransferase